ncbi:hypothetical protein IMSAGC019_01142 [Lachnospiraceae bacterium]|nr:hypothetical protein IMSAGC019_01142 [Lachnospiraceae bacterium]
MKGKWSPGKITGVVLGSVGAGFLLLGSFYIGAIQLTRELQVFSRERAEGKARREEDAGKGTQGWLDGYNGPSYGDPQEGYGDEKETPGGGVSENPEYYEFHDAIRRDLSYQVAFENYSSQLGENENVWVEVNYPVVSGREDSELSVINHAIQKELEEITEYADSVAESISEEERYTFEAESYITYMDEKLLSVAYVEYGYLNDEIYETYIITANVDMENNMALTNSQILDIDDAFSIDFRNRCQKQNGEIEVLSLFTDQDITDLLTNDTSLIIAYTPVGMEIGFNYYYGWVTVTYQDYQKFQNHF